MFRKRSRPAAQTDLGDGAPRSDAALRSSILTRASTRGPQRDSDAESESDEEGGSDVVVATKTRHIKTFERGAVGDDRNLATKRRRIGADDLSVKYAGNFSTSLDRTDEATVATSAPALELAHRQQPQAKQASRPSTAFCIGATGHDKRHPEDESSIVSKHSSVGGSHSGVARGPSRDIQSASMRAITVIDYAPDVCKDYKQTGFCGFGDTCKFLHDRGDFKQGWQLDRDWESAAQSRRMAIVSSDQQTGESEARDRQEASALIEQKIPFRCIICRGDYKSPVETRCGHFFCEACAITRYRTTPACAACGTSTAGIFNAAKKLRRLLVARESRVKPPG